MHTIHVIMYLMDIVTFVMKSIIKIALITFSFILFWNYINWIKYYTDSRTFVVSVLHLSIPAAF